MFGNLSYVFIEKSLFHEEVRNNNGLFEALHVEAKIKEVRIKEQQQHTRVQQLYQEIQQEERVSVISHGSKLILGARKIGDFYHYNRQWQMSVQEKRQGRVREALHDVSEVEEKENTQNRVSIVNHKGPVKAWGQHFAKYLKKRTDGYGNQEQGMFQPKIDRESQRIAQRNGIDQLPVQDRLLKYGELKKISRAKEMKEKFNEGCKKAPLARANSQTFDRLYFDGKKQNEKKLMMQDSKCTFQPVINTNTCYEQKVQQNRKPLYYVKTEPAQEPESKPKKKLTEQQFSRFLSRNNDLLTKRVELVARKPTKIDDGYADCTFRPVINEKSNHMVDLLRKEASRQAQLKKTIAAAKEFINNQDQAEPECMLEAKNRNISVPKIQIRNLMNFSMELLQTEDSMPMRTQQSKQQTQQISENRQLTEREEAQLSNRQRLHQQIQQNALLTDEFDLIERQLEDMLRQVE